MQLVWYERRAKFQPEVSSESGVEDKEVVLLEETDVNPLGCIAGKCAVFITGDAEEVRQTTLKWAPSDSPLTPRVPAPLLTSMHNVLTLDNACVPGAADGKLSGAWGGVVLLPKCVPAGERPAGATATIW